MALKTTRANAAAIAANLKSNADAHVGSSSRDKENDCDGRDGINNDNALTPKYTADEALAELNAQSAAWLSGAAGLGSPAPQWLSSAQGPCWNRFYSQPYDVRTKQIIDGMLREILR